MAVNLHGGPHDGTQLSLQNAPRLLRVVCNRLGRVDALDMQGDEPTASETITVYERFGEVGRYHLTRSTPSGQRRGERLCTATYRYLEEQPDVAKLREQGAWLEWCAERWK